MVISGPNERASRTLAAYSLPLPPASGMPDRKGIRRPAWYKSMFHALSEAVKPLVYNGAHFGQWHNGGTRRAKTHKTREAPTMELIALRRIGRPASLQRAG